jgi:hypothetical protein
MATTGALGATSRITRLPVSDTETEHVLNPRTRTILISNTGPNTVYFRMATGISAAVATPNGYDFVDGGVGNDQIVRKDGLSWIDKGHLLNGTITVANATTVANDGVYTILAITASTIDVATASLTADTDDNTATFGPDGAGFAIPSGALSREIPVAPNQSVGATAGASLFLTCVDTETAAVSILELE